MYRRMCRMVSPKSARPWVKCSRCTNRRLTCLISYEDPMLALMGEPIFQEPTTSAIGSKADFRDRCRHACFVPLADLNGLRLLFS